MSGVLVLTSRLPYPLQNGGSLRTFHLAHELGKHQVCHLATFDEQSEAEVDLLATGVFRSITHLPLPTGRPSPLRHVRWSNESYWRSTYPVQFKSVTETLQRLVSELDVKLVVAMGIYVAEFLLPLQGVRKLVDDCDCQWLTKMRERRIRNHRSSPSRWLAETVQLYRTRAQESRLTSWADLVTTISPVDQAALLQVTRTRPEAIRRVPNGVAPALIRPNQGEAELANAVAFWGNLDFAPNRAAVEYFCTEVFLPYLRTTGTLFFVIGSNPSPELVRLSRMEPAIRVLGFVDDLFGLVARIPVVVNPLISGTGLKNKVLEAFALGRAVVSTSLGMEAIEAINGDHFVAADDPKTFAAAVSGLLAAPQERSRLGANARAFVLQRYTWESIGGEWVQLAAEAMGGQ